MNEPKKEFIKLMRELSRRHNQWEVFRDFCEMSAIALAQAAVVFKSEEREQRYLRTAGRYSKEEVHKICGLLAWTVEGLSVPGEDFLGTVFQELELASHWHGQYFTPMSIARLMADVNIDDDITKICNERGYVTVHEPACGSGAMLIAFAEAMRDRGLEPQRQMHAVAIDADSTAAHMAFIQLSLLHIPAQVYHGNSLSMKMNECFETLAHTTGLWRFRLARRNDQSPPPDIKMQQAELQL